jgi:hypothetical protein
MRRSRSERADYRSPSKCMFALNSKGLTTTIKSNQREIISKIYAHTHRAEKQKAKQSSSSTCAMTAMAMET